MLLLAGSAFLHGLRHGIDWDHLAAIADLTGNRSRRQGLLLATAYAAGHAAMLLVLGAAAVLGGSYLPAGLDAAMGRVVGVTLIALAVWVAVGVVRDGRDFRMKSRWSVVGSGMTRAGRWARDRVVAIRHTHPHDHDGHGHGHTHPVPQLERDADGGGDGDGGEPARVATRIGHSHEHVHLAIEPQDPFVRRGLLSAAGIGVLHGVGAETPTQVVVLLAATRVTGNLEALALLLAFVVGLFLANTAVALVATTGYVTAARNVRVYLGVALGCAAISAVTGVVFLFGGSLPSLGG
jgi:high-affinity nickel-transport protein